MSNEHTGRDSTSLVTLGVLAGVGFLGYEYVYKPWAIQQEYQRQLLAYQMQHPGSSQQDAVAAVGNIACQAAAAYFTGGKSVMFKPTGNLCAFAGALESKLLSFEYGVTKKVLGGTAKGAGYAYNGAKSVVNTAVVSPIKAIVSGGRSFVNAIANIF